VGIVRRVVISAAADRRVEIGRRGGISVIGHRAAIAVAAGRRAGIVVHRDVTVVVRRAAKVRVVVRVRRLVRSASGRKSFRARFSRFKIE
jgi:hypothetical protein